MVGSELMPAAPSAPSFIPYVPTFRPDATPEFRATIEGLATFFNNTGRSAHLPIEIVEPRPAPPIPRPSPQELMRAILDPTGYEAAHQAIDAFAECQRSIAVAADMARQRLEETRQLMESRRVEIEAQRSCLARERAELEVLRCPETGPATQVFILQSHLETQEAAHAAALDLLERERVQTLDAHNHALGTAEDRIRDQRDLTNPYMEKIAEQRSELQAASGREAAASRSAADRVRALEQQLRSANSQLAAAQADLQSTTDTVAAKEATLVRKREQLSAARQDAMVRSEDLDSLRSQRRRDAKALFGIAGRANAALQQLGLPTSDLADRDFANITRFFAGLVGKIEALPLMVSQEMQDEARSIADVVARTVLPRVYFLEPRFTFGKLFEAYEDDDDRVAAERAMESSIAETVERTRRPTL